MSCALSHSQQTWKRIMHGIQPISSQMSTHNKPGYKVAVDNIDKNIKPCDVHLDSPTKSLHYVQIYSVKDRIEFSSLPELPKTGDMCVYDILLSTEDFQNLEENLSILVACTMTDNQLSFFSDDLKALVQRHTQHPYSHEMSTKSSEVVRCT